MMQCLEGAKMGFGLVMGGAVAVLVLYMLVVLLPGYRTSSKTVKQSRMNW